MAAAKSVSISPDMRQTHNVNNLDLAYAFWPLYRPLFFLFCFPSFLLFSLTVAGVAEHHAEQEWKRHDGVERRVGLAIRRHAVRVNQVLKAPGELVSPVERRRVLVRVDHVEKGRYGAAAESLKQRMPRFIVRDSPARA